MREERGRALPYDHSGAYVGDVLPKSQGGFLVLGSIHRGPLFAIPFEYDDHVLFFPTVVVDVVHVSWWWVCVGHKLAM